MDKEKIINILLILVILGAVFGGRYYYLQSTKANSSIENVHKKIEQIYEDISELDFIPFNSALKRVVWKGN